MALANVAATLVRQPLEDVTEESLDQQIDVNLKSNFFLARAAGQEMVATGVGGRIINFSSAGFLRGPLQGAHTYVASKGGIIGLTRGFARYFGPHGITVNTVMPGQIDTPMQRVDNTPETIAATIAQSSLRRMGQPEEVASVVVFLASRHASFVTGATITRGRRRDDVLTDGTTLALIGTCDFHRYHLPPSALEFVVIADTHHIVIRSCTELKATR